MEFLSNRIQKQGLLSYNDFQYFDDNNIVLIENMFWPKWWEKRKFFLVLFVFLIEYSWKFHYRT
jgi:hypothetical protein